MATEISFHRFLFLRTLFFKNKNYSIFEKIWVIRAFPSYPSSTVPDLNIKKKNNTHGLKQGCVMCEPCEADVRGMQAMKRNMRAIKKDKE